MTVRAGSISLDFRVYEFEEAGRPLFVFVGSQYSGGQGGGASTSTAGPEEWTRVGAGWLLGGAGETWVSVSWKSP